MAFDLGMGDLSGLIDKIHGVVPMDQQADLVQKLSKGNFTLRILYEQFQNALKMGPMAKFMELFQWINRLILFKNCQKETSP